MPSVGPLWGDNSPGKTADFKRVSWPTAVLLPREPVTVPTGGWNRAPPGVGAPWAGPRGGRKKGAVPRALGGAVRCPTPRSVCSRPPCGP